MKELKVGTNEKVGGLGDGKWKVLLSENGARFSLLF